MMRSLRMSREGGREGGRGGWQVGVLAAACD